MTFRQLAYHNVFRNRRSYAAFFLASVVSVMVFFVYSMFIFHPLFEEDGLQVLAVRGMFIAEVVLYIFTLFFLFYSMSAFFAGTVEGVRNSYAFRDDQKAAE